MPEYLSPGVYTEEVSFRSKSIEGVPTSTTGIAGLTRYGPVHYPNGPLSTAPRLITSFTEFESTYGGLEDLEVVDTFPGSPVDRLNVLAHAVRAFFLNGGQRIYVSRVFVPSAGDPNAGLASSTVSVAATTATWRARWPGALGNVRVTVNAVRSGNIAYDSGGGAIQVRNARPGAVVEIRPPGPQLPNTTPPALADLAVVGFDVPTQKFTFKKTGGAYTPGPTDVIRLVELSVTAELGPDQVQVFNGLGAVDDPNQRRYVGRILEKEDPEDENAAIWLDFDPLATGVTSDLAGVYLVERLTQNAQPFLTGGNDGANPSPDDLNGQEADPDDQSKPSTGLTALADVDDIAIVAMPDSVIFDDDDDRFTAAQYLVAHAEDAKYRIAVVDAKQHSSLNEVREWRGKFDSKYAALYHPWIEILDPLARPTQGAPPKRILLPPSGFVTGIYARSDIERGVHKAPANEIVRGLTRFEANINKRRQDVLNPEGINALRFFEGRGNRVWGARTMSSDPEWKYVNVRRLFAYLEHSIDKGSQWAVFEPNSDRLWANMRETVSNFLYQLWKDGALLGTKPEEAFFVRCDRTTMTQNDIDNGRLIVLVGVAPVKPAEFVIFRVGQFTFNAKNE